MDYYTSVIQAEVGQLYDRGSVPTGNWNFSLYREVFTAAYVVGSGAHSLEVTGAWVCC